MCVDDVKAEIIKKKSEQKNSYCKYNCWIYRYF